MDKSAIKTFAINARKKLLEQVKQKAFQIGITEKEITELNEEAGYVILNNIPQEKSFKDQRNKLKQEIQQKGYNQVMEEVAYTWFNRFIALRYMEVNNYLPTGVRVLSSLDPLKTEPDIICDALNVDLPVDRTVIYDYQDHNDTEGLFKYLIIHQCNALNEILPFMFEKIADYSELLFPSYLLQEGSVVRELVTSIEEPDWQEVEIIGWLYQYYISEKKDEVFADLKKNKKITKENIPAATQLFTPKWIVQYMVENSLGRLWLESHPNDDLKSQWKYYLEEAEQEPEVQKQLEELKNPNLNPLEIKVLDPCCGSGHILVYAFEVLYEIYKSYGYLEEDIPKLVLENNLFGLDIDDRAAQLASFAVMMKARQKSSGVFRENIQLNICAIQESNWMKDDIIEILVDSDADKLEQYRQRDILQYLAKSFKNAKEYGSILDVKELDLEFLEKRINVIENSVASDLFDMPHWKVILEKLPGIILEAKIMGAKYDVVCTNPPYMGNKSMNPILTEFVQREYPNSKLDLFAVFIERCIKVANQNAFTAMITQHSWMFLSSFEELRKKLMSYDVVNMAHLGARAFEEIGGEVVQTAAFVFRNKGIKNYRAIYIRLVDYDNALLKEENYFTIRNKYITQKENFSSIPGIPFGYWVSQQVRSSFENNKLLREFARPRVGQNTGDNDRFLRKWFEVSINKIERNVSHKELEFCKAKWIPYNKGGSFRRWYGNFEYIVNWENNGEEIKKYAVVRNKGKHWSRYIQNIENMCKEGVTWSDIASTRFACRYMPIGYICDVKGSSMFPEPEYRDYILAFLNSHIAIKYLQILNPTTTFQVGNIGSLPLIFDITKKENIAKMTVQNVSISKADWDSFEVSWDFKNHPILIYKNETLSIEQSLLSWTNFSQTQFSQLKSNEEELNRIFIDIYGLQDELTPEVEDKDITIRKADRERDIKSFISYAVGCMLGRYSLDEEGLIFAGGKFDPTKYKTFKADADGILPILDDAYFEDDIVSKFVEFVKVTFGEDTLAENLDYIAETLGQKANESARECIRRYFLKDFYKDHVQTYKKRPIYWLFTSGREQGFNALIYMHRYDSSTVSRVRTDYLHPLQNKLEAEYQRLNSVLESDDSQADKNKATKHLKVLTKQMEELKKYDEVIHNLADQQIEIDLDDGVVVNYAKFGKVLAKI